MYFLFLEPSQALIFKKDSKIQTLHVSPSYRVKMAARTGFEPVHQP